MRRNPARGERIEVEHATAAEIIVLCEAFEKLVLRIWRQENARRKLQYRQELMGWRVEWRD
jgi:hypothetical protein